MRLLIVAIAVIAACGCSADPDQGEATASPTADPVALSCDSSAVKTAASSKLAEWTNQHTAATHVSAPLVVAVAFSANVPSTPGSAFVAADGSSSTVGGDPKGTQRCTANFVIAFKEANGTLFAGYAPNGFTAQFLLASAPDGPQITLADDDMPATLIEEASAIKQMEAEREQPHNPSESAQPSP